MGNLSGNVPIMGKELDRHQYKIDYAEYMAFRTLVPGKFGKFGMAHAVSNTVTDMARDLGIDAGKLEVGVDVGGAFLLMWTSKQEGKVAHFVELIIDKNAVKTGKVTEHQVDSIMKAFNRLLANAKKQAKAFEGLQEIVSESWKKPSGNWSPMVGSKLDDMLRSTDDAKTDSEFIGEVYKKKGKGNKFDAEAFVDDLERTIKKDPELAQIYNETRLRGALTGMKGRLSGISLSGAFIDDIKNIVHEHLRTALVDKVPEKLFQERVGRIIRTALTREGATVAEVIAKLDAEVANGLAKEGMIPVETIDDALPKTKGLGERIMAQRTVGNRISTWFKGNYKKLLIMGAALVAVILLDKRSSVGQVESSGRQQAVLPLFQNYESKFDKIIKDYWEEADKKNKDMASNQTVHSVRGVIADIWGQNSLQAIIKGNEDTFFGGTTRFNELVERVSKKLDDPSFIRAVKAQYAEMKKQNPDPQAEAVYGKYYDPVASALLHSIAEIQVEHREYGMFSDMSSFDIEGKFTSNLLLDYRGKNYQEMFKGSEFFTRLIKRETELQAREFIKDMPLYNSEIDLETLDPSRYSQERDAISSIASRAVDRVNDSSFVSKVEDISKELNAEANRKHAAGEITTEELEEITGEIKRRYNPMAAAVYVELADALSKPLGQNHNALEMFGNSRLRDVEEHFVEYLIPEARERFVSSEYYKYLQNSHAEAIASMEQTLNENNPTMLPYLTNLGLTVEDLKTVQDAVGGPVEKQVTRGFGKGESRNKSPYTDSFPEPRELTLNKGKTALIFGCRITDEGGATSRQVVLPFSFHDPENLHSATGREYPFPPGTPLLRAMDIEGGKVYLETVNEGDERKHTVNVGETFNVLVVLDQNAGTWSMHMQRQSEEYKELAKGEFDVEKYVKDGKLNAVVGGAYASNRNGKYHKLGIEMQ